LNRHRWLVVLCLPLLVSVFFFGWCMYFTGLKKVERANHGRAKLHNDACPNWEGQLEAKHVEVKW
jgi:hypothetical protein